MIAVSPSRPSVLVVDDDPLVRMHVIDIVEDAGFVAISAKDADEAIAILEDRSDITLLFTDLHMPGSMDGLKLAHAVRDRWPPIKIVVVSGRMQVTQDELPTNSRFYAKPFHAEKMIKELQAFVQG
jgi:two-component system, response regulator PdtaR